MRNVSRVRGQCEEEMEEEEEEEGTLLEQSGTYPICMWANASYRTIDTLSHTLRAILREWVNSSRRLVTSLK